MEQAKRREYLIRYLLKEGGYSDEMPSGEEEKKRLLRSLFNVRMPRETDEEFLKIQDEYLQEESALRGVTDCETLSYKNGIALWQGDITSLKADGIVNAANCKMLGCFAPCHACIDNAIHTFSGIQLRRECYNIMLKQGCDEKTGQEAIRR